MEEPEFGETVIEVGWVLFIHEVPSQKWKPRFRPKRLALLLYVPGKLLVGAVTALSLPLTY